MDKQFHILVAYLIALQNYAKDFHYYCKSFGKHLFCDVISDDLYDYTDEIRENVMLGNEELPLPCKIYLDLAAELAPMVTSDDRLNLLNLYEFLKTGSAIISVITANSRGENAILDEIAGHLDKGKGLTFLQLRKFGTPVTEAEVEHCKACSQKAIDRAKAKLAKIDYDNVAKTILDYEAQNLLVAEEEENTLDKLSKKLGI